MTNTKISHLNIYRQTMKIILVMIAATAVCACNKDDKQRFEIRGKVTSTDMDGSLIYLAGLEGNTLVYADSTVIADSTFMFTGIQDNPQIKYLIPLRMAKQTYTPQPFILENGHIKAEISDSGLYVSGTRLNDELNKYRHKKEEYNKSRSKLYQAYKDSLRNMTKEKENTFISKYRTVENDETDYLVNLINKNNDNVLGGYILLENRYILSNEQKQTILAKASEEFFLLEGITSIAEALKRRDNLNAGKRLPDVQLLDAGDGELHPLSQYIGKGNFMVVNIWASWSIPSVAAIYDVKNLARKYAHKGVEILSISIDTVAEKWNEAIRQNGIYWTNLADLKGWDGEVTATYQINTIPNYMLINPDGTIVLSEGSFEEIESKLNQLLNN